MIRTLRIDKKIINKMKTTLKLLTVFSLFVIMALKPLTINVPLYHTTSGTLQPPIVVPGNNNDPVWSADLIPVAILTYVFGLQ